MKKQIVATVLAMAASAAMATEYKWTGAVSSDFTDAGNWLVNGGGAWVATETPPRNEYGYDDAVFEGDASECANMPVVGENYILRRIFFRSGGWTLTVADGVQLDLVHGNGGTWNGAGNKIGNEISIQDTSGDGLTNIVRGALHYIPACSFSAVAGAVLKLDGTIKLDRGGYGGSQMTYGFYGQGTIHLTGNSTFSTGGQSCTIDKPTVICDITGAKAFDSQAFYLKSGRLEMRQAGQMGNGNIYLSGDAVVDLGGFYHQGNFHFGATSSSVSADWTGSLQNVGELRMGANDTGYTLSPKAQPVVFPYKVDGPSKWQNNGENNKIKVGDIPGVEEEIVFNGPLGGNANNKNGGSLYFNGLEIDGQTTYGAVSLNAATGFSGIYTRAFLSTTLYVNNTGDESKSSLGSPLTIKVNPNTGVLRGDGLVLLYASNASYTPYLNVYGTLAPGSVKNPAGTLTIQRSGTAIDFTSYMRTNSTFRIAVAPNGACPSVVQKDGRFVVQTPASVRQDLAGQGLDESAIDAALAGVVAPKIVVSGANAPASGTHRILSVTGTLSGEFAPEVELDFPKSARYTVTPIYSKSDDGKTTYVDLKVRKSGMVLLVM